MKLFGGRAKRTPPAAGAARRRPKRRTVIWTCVALLVVGLGVGVLALKSAIQPPPIIPAPPRETPPPAELPEEVREPLVEQEEGSSPDLLWAGRREDVYTFVLAGTNDDYNTDVLMVAALDTANGTLDVLSIPRDTQVAPRGYVRKINAAWGVGGPDGLREELRGLIGFAPDSYVVVGLEGFVRLVDDVIGGVDFDVPKGIRDREAGINIPAGPQRLDGETALQLVRFRGYALADIRRIEVQHEFLFTVVRQTLQLKNILKIPELASIAQDHLRTDLALGNLIWLGGQLMKLDEGDIRFHTLPVDIGKMIGKTDYAVVRKDEALALINETVNPYLDPLTAEDITISRVYD